MSWTDCFPILTDEQVSHYKGEASPEKRAILESLFAGQNLDPKHTGSHLICLTLSPELPPPGKVFSVLMPPGPWNDLKGGIPAAVLAHLRNTAFRLASERPGVGLRIYLDPAWSESSRDLLEAGCEVILMAQRSNGPNPASLWRFLALEEDIATIYLSLADLDQADAFIERSIALRATEMKMWRSPMDRRLNYRPIDPDRFGSIQARQTRDLLCAFCWCVQRAQSDHQFQSADRYKENHLLGVKQSERQADWNGPDLAEFFLMSAIYPRAAFDGMLSLIEADDNHSRWQIFDVEYATWANPNSEVLFVDSGLPASLVKPGALKESTLVASMFERLMLENRYPEYFEAWRQEKPPGGGIDASRASQPPIVRLDLESSTKETP